MDSTRLRRPFPWTNRLRKMRQAFVLWSHLHAGIRYWERKTPKVSSTPTGFIARQRGYAQTNGKDRLWDMAWALAFWASLLFGIWHIADGLYHGPNYAATRLVTVDQVNSYTEEDVVNIGHHGSKYTYHYWMVDYHYTHDAGHIVTGGIKVENDEPIARRLRKARPGDALLLRIPVAGNESGARWGFNPSVRQGLGIAYSPLVLGYFYRYGEIKLDSKIWLLKFLLVFFGGLFGLGWLTSPAIP